MRIGACLAFQNNAKGAGAYGSNEVFPFMGYHGIDNSVALTLELGTGASTSVGRYTGGSIGSGSAATAPVNLQSGNPILVTVEYADSLLHAKLVDSVTSATFETTFPVNIPSAVGGSTAFVGLTAGTSTATNQAGLADQYFSHLTFTTTPAPGSFSILGLVGVAAGRRRRPLA